MSRNCGSSAADHRGPDEPAVAVVHFAAGDDLALPPTRASSIAAACVLNDARIDHGAHEVLEVGDVADADARHLVCQSLAHVLPEALRHVRARRGGALLALVLERAAQDRGGDRVRVRGRVRDDEVLAAGLADEARV